MARPSVYITHGDHPPLRILHRLYMPCFQRSVKVIMTGL